MRPTFPRGFALLPFLLAAACHAAVPSQGEGAADNGSIAGFAGGDEENIRRGLMHHLLAMEYADPQSGRKLRCEELFELAEPVIADTYFERSTGKASIRVPVTPAHPLTSPEHGAYFPGDGCYGEPAGGWKQGQTATVTYEVAIAKWRSGWKVSEHQDFVPIE